MPNPKYPESYPKHSGSLGHGNPKPSQTVVEHDTSKESHKGNSLSRGAEATKHAPSTGK